jgi:hypothetical protein
MWCIRVIVLHWKHNSAFCVVVVVVAAAAAAAVVVELHVTFNNIKIVNVTQQCFYVKFMKPETAQIIHAYYLKRMIFQPICIIFTHTAYKRCNETKQCSFPNVFS